MKHPIKLTVENDKALVEVHYEKNEYREAGSRIYEWSRELVNHQYNHFEVEVFIEGYRQMQDIWHHDTYKFNTLEEALSFYQDLTTASQDERAKILNFSQYDFHGWYGFSFEYAKIFEYTEKGLKFLWKKKD